MRHPRITRATLGLACSKCNRLLNLRERYLRDEAVNAFAAICEPCAAPSLTRTEPMRAGYTKCECGRYRRNGHACRMCARRAA